MVALAVAALVNVRRAAAGGVRGCVQVQHAVHHSHFVLLGFEAAGNKRERERKEEG